MKDMIEFLKERLHSAIVNTIYTSLSLFFYRAAIEDQYARNLSKLSKSTLGDQEEGLDIIPLVTE